MCSCNTHTDKINAKEMIEDYFFCHRVSVWSLCYTGSRDSSQVPRWTFIHWVLMSLTSVLNITDFITLGFFFLEVFGLWSAYLLIYLGSVGEHRALTIPGITLPLKRTQLSTYLELNRLWWITELKEPILRQNWWPTPVISALKRLKQEDQQCTADSETVSKSLPPRTFKKYILQ